MDQPVKACLFWLFCDIVTDGKKFYIFDIETRNNGMSGVYKIENTASYEKL